MNRQPVDEHSTTMCASCTTDLATCDTILAAEGILYCSKECCLYDFEFGNKYGKTADEYFDAVAEEINPHDIGLCTTTDPMMKGDETNDDTRKVD